MADHLKNPNWIKKLNSNFLKRNADNGFRFLLLKIVVFILMIVFFISVFKEIMTISEILNNTAYGRI